MADSRPVRRGRRPRLAGLAALGVLAAAGGAAGWIVTDRLERDNDFCNACHLDADTRLHSALRRDFDAAPPASLAALHGGARVEGRADPAFRCIDCHGGASPLGRVRVKALAAKDAFWYVTGHFEEPDAMRWPLWDEDCRKCHATFAGQRWDGSGPQPFHAEPQHNTALAVRCVECHRVHEPGGNAEAGFLHAEHVLSQCARCHPEYEEEYR